MWRRCDDNCKTTTIRLSWALNITIYDNIDILPIPSRFVCVDAQSIRGLVPAVCLCFFRQSETRVCTSTQKFTAVNETYPTVYHFQHSIEESSPYEWSCKQLVPGVGGLGLETRIGGVHNLIPSLAGLGCVWPMVGLLSSIPVAFLSECSGFHWLPAGLCIKDLVCELTSATDYQECEC